MGLRMVPGMGVNGNGGWNGGQWERGSMRMVPGMGVNGKGGQ